MSLFKFFMLLLAVTVKTVSTAKVSGSDRETETDVTFDNSYPTGGEVVTAEQSGLTRVTSGYCQLLNGTEAEATPVTSAVLLPQEDGSAKVKLLNGKTSKELANEADASKVVVRVFARGK